MRARHFCFLVSAIVGCSSASGNDPGPSFTPPEAGPDVSTPQEAGDGKAGGAGALIDPDAGQADHWDPPYCANTDLTGDLDKDGYSVNDGDCNDCTALMNPGAYDYVDGVDENCDGEIDNDGGDCDQGLAIEGNDAMDAARSMGLCRVAKPGATGKDKTWGVISAKYVYPDGSTSSKAPGTYVGCQGSGGEGAPPNPLSHGILPTFGANLVTRQGQSMVALSSGVAREGVNGNSPGGAVMCTRSKVPPGFPTPSTNCPGQTVDPDSNANDGMALEIVLRVPSNAKAFSYDFDFYTYEFPGWVCDAYNDYFVALLLPPHAGSGPNNNISFDSANNPVSVNNALLEVCTPGKYGGKQFACPMGTDELKGTGFDAAGATGWLQTTAAVVAGEEITLRFAIWDSVDEMADATVLLDNFRWEVEELPPGTIRPPK
ncbi:MAG: putative metal-binding motif-containing protein [Deltaproteobacteria bacterium]|nr:putative metal-binding motif-containing protein [Deltaproteobacteria bacterium]